MNIRNNIKKIKILTGPLYFLKHKHAEIKRSGIIKKYLQTASCRKLNLGCGGYILEGWLNTDLGIYDNRISVRLDVTKKMPFSDNTFDFVNAEHLIEHLPYPRAGFMLGECHRILKENGVIRISTPDFEFFMKEIYPNRDNRYGWYLKYYNDRFFGYPEISPTIFINGVFNSWGHSFLYDFKTLKMILEETGFRKPKRLAVQKSAYPELTGIEMHGKMNTREDVNTAESLVAEAVK